MTAAFISCSEDKDMADVTPPTIKVHRSSILISGAEVILVSGNELRIGDNLVASWTDNVSKECSVKLEIDGQAITSGYKVTES